MAMASGKFPLGDALINLSEQLIAQQERLDNSYLDRLRDFSLLWETARALGFEGLAREVVPSALAIDRIEMQIECQVTSSRETEFGLAVRLLNLGYHRRYAYAEHSRSTIEIAVQRVPFPSPGNRK